MAFCLPSTSRIKHVFSLHKGAVLLCLHLSDYQIMHLSTRAESRTYTLYLLKIYTQVIKKRVIVKKTT